MALPTDPQIDAAIAPGTGTTGRGDLLNTILKSIRDAFAGYQASSGVLTLLAALTPAADKLPYFTGSGSAALAAFTTFGRLLIGVADATTARAALGLGAAAQASIGTGAGTVAAGNDSRFTDARSLAAGTTLPYFFVTEATKGSGYTVASSDSGKALIATAAITFIIPSAATLGAGFTCEIWNDSGGTVVLDGPGSTNLSLVADEVATVAVRNAKVRAAKGASTVIS